MPPRHRTATRRYVGWPAWMASHWHTSRPTNRPTAPAAPAAQDVGFFGNVRPRLSRVHILEEMRQARHLAPCYIHPPTPFLYTSEVANISPIYNTLPQACADEGLTTKVSSTPAWTSRLTAYPPLTSRHAKPRPPLHQGTAGASRQGIEFAVGTGATPSPSPPTYTLP